MSDIPVTNFETFHTKWKCWTWRHGIWVCDHCGFGNTRPDSHDCREYTKK